MHDENALPEQVIALFRELGCVLSDARTRLDALVEAAELAVPLPLPHDRHPAG